MLKTLSLAALAALAATTAVASAASTSSSPVLRARTPIAARTLGSRPVGSDAALASFLSRIGARYVGPAKFGKMTVNISTPLRNEAGLRAYASAASAPNSVYYRHFLTPAQIAGAFGTPANQYVAAARYFSSFGLAVKQWTPRTMLAVTGSSVNLERALHTRFGTYQTRNRITGRYTSFTAPTTSVALAASIGAPSLASLVTAQTVSTHSFIGGPSVPVSGSFSNARVNGATPNELAQAYDYVGAYNAGYTGKGVNLGIIGTGPISLSDVPTYKKLYNVPGSSTVSIVPATVNGDSTPPPVTGPCASTGALMGVSPIDPTATGTSTSPTATCNPEDIEAQLDTEQTAGLARDANVLFYLAYNGSGCQVESNPVLGGCVGPASTSQGLFLTDDELMQAVNDNQADILSLSYGGCEVLDTALLTTQANPGADATGTDPTLFMELATEGVAVFVSSGDSGSAACQRVAGNSDAPNVSYPSSDPNVVAVGGTTTPMLPSGVLSGPITVWGSPTKSGGAEGAGVSTLFNTPPYQMNESNVAALCTMRCQPDVVLDADPFSGAAVIANSGPTQGGITEEPVGGTSQAAPDMAAMWAIVLSACEVTPKCVGNFAGNVSDPTTPPYSPTNAAPHKFRLGNPNYLWYKLADPANAAQYHQVFYDTVFGDDGVPPYAAQLAAAEAGTEGATVDSYAGGVDPGSYSATAGYDVVSGLGAPFARALVKYVVGV